MPPQTSLPPHGFAGKYLELNGNKAQLQRFYGVGRVKMDGWIAQVVDDESGSMKRTIDLADLPKGRPAEMIEERGMDPAEWQVSAMTINEWEMGDDLNRQTKLTVTPIKQQVRAARVDGWKPPKPKKRDADVTDIDFVCGDHQAPYHDKAMHAATINWLAEVKPRRGIINGDLVDLPSVSKYPKRDKWNATVNECNDAGYGILCDYRSASPDTVWTLVFGNHEKRLADKIARDFDEASTIRPACSGEMSLSLATLLRLDELGIAWMDDYPHDVFKLSPDTAVRHGDKSRPGSGATSQHETKDRRYNIFVNHNHKSAITCHTSHDIDGNPMTTYGIEVGASCQIVGGMGFSVQPDWQNSHATATFDKDGILTPELIYFAGGKLRWRGEAWRG